MANNTRTRQAAQNALAAYTATPGFDGNDDRESITDLIADLAFLADQLGDGEFDGDFVLNKGQFHYDMDKAEGETDEDEDDWDDTDEDDTDED